MSRDYIIPVELPEGKHKEIPDLVNHLDSKDNIYFHGLDLHKKKFDGNIKIFSNNNEIENNHYIFTNKETNELESILKLEDEEFYKLIQPKRKMKK